MEQKQQEQNEVQLIHIICDNFGQQKLQLQINDILYVSNELKLDEEYFENFNELEEFIKTNTYNLTISGTKATLTYVIKILRKQINFIFECFSQPIILNDIIDENRLLKKRVKNLEKELDGLRDELKTSIIIQSKEEEHRRLILTINGLFDNIIRDYDEHGVNNNMNLQNPQFLHNVVEINTQICNYTIYEYLEKYFSSYKTSLTKDQDRNIYFCNFGRIPIKNDVLTLNFNCSSLGNYQLSLEKDKSYNFDKIKLINVIINKYSLGISDQPKNQKYSLIIQTINPIINQKIYQRNYYHESDLNSELDYEITTLKTIKGSLINIMEQINNAKIVNAYIKFI